MEQIAIQVVVMSAGQPASRALGIWLSRHRLDWRYGSQDYGIDAARNQNVTRFLLEDLQRGKTHLLMIDHDMVPVSQTDPILTAAAEIDLAYCGYADRFGSPGHYGDGNLGAACFRVSAGLLTRMRRPWFQSGYLDGQRIACECGYFRLLAARCGVGSVMVGVIGHEQRCVLLPGARGAGFTLHWPPEFEDVP